MKVEKTNFMLFKILSEKLDKRGQPYVDYYLGYLRGEKVKLTRVSCVFFIDFKNFDKLAVKLDSLDEVVKYF